MSLSQQLASPTRQVVFFTETTFIKRDYDRFGVELLAGNFEVRIIDCTPLLQPKFWSCLAVRRHACPGYVDVHDWAQLAEAIAGLDANSVAVDFLFFGAAEDRVRAMLRKRGVRRAVVFSGLLPEVRGTIWSEPRLNLRIAREFFRRGYNHFRCKVSPYISLPANIPDMAVISGRMSLNSARACCPLRIYAHSFDYDLFLRERALPAKPLHSAVFLDQNLAVNGDRLVTGSSPCVSEERYFVALNRFFDRFELITGCSVIIAARPRTEYGDVTRLFGHRSVVFGKTPELVRNARLVFAHYSTAISFAVMLRRPVVLLTNEEMLSSKRQQNVDAFRQHLAVPMVNIDRAPPDAAAMAAWATFSEPAYAAFEEMHIKMRGTPERQLWEIFADDVLGRRV
jgi:hypothetical protein